MFSEYAYRKAPTDLEFHFIINQVQYIEDLLANKKLAYDDELGATIDLLARYYRNYKGLSKEDASDAVYRIISQVCDASWVCKVIDRACSKNRLAGGRAYMPLRDFNGIWITQKEIDIIQQLESLEEQELLFGVLCFTKMYDENNRRHNRKVNHLWYVDVSVLRRCIGWKKGTKEKLEHMLQKVLLSGKHWYIIIL
jgi:hypothetical protein